MSAVREADVDWWLGLTLKFETLMLLSRTSCSFYSDFHSDLDDLAELSRYSQSECQSNYEALQLTSNPDGAMTALCKLLWGVVPRSNLDEVNGVLSDILQIPHLERFFMSRVLLLISLTRSHPQLLLFTP